MSVGVSDIQASVGISFRFIFFGKTEKNGRKISRGSDVSQFFPIQIKLVRLEVEKMQIPS